MAVTPILSHISTRSALKKRKSMGEIGDPCGISVTILRTSLIWPSKVSDNILFLRKFSVHPTIYSGVFLFFRLYRNLAWDILKNAPEISKLSINTICSVPLFQIIWIYFTSNSNAVSVDLFFLAPICFLGSRPCVSARLLRRFAIIDSSAFPIVSSRAMGLYELGFI